MKLASLGALLFGAQLMTGRLPASPEIEAGLAEIHGLAGELPIEASRRTSV